MKNVGDGGKAFFIAHLTAREDTLLSCRSVGSLMRAKKEES